MYQFHPENDQNRSEKEGESTKTLIAIPAMQTVPTKFLRCLENLRRLPDTYTSVIECSLIHDARNEFTSIAIQNDFDRVLWIDSDMTFDADALIRLSRDMDDCNGVTRDMVCGLFFKRTPVTMPVLYSGFRKDIQNGQNIYTPVPLPDYPEDSLFKIGGCGFGLVMTSVPLLRAAWDRYGPPFDYLENVGEDFSFCIRVQDMKVPIWCDSSVKAGHVGQIIYTEQYYKAQQSAKAQQANPKEG